MKTNSEYLNAGGNICPRCGSDAISAGILEADSNIAWCSVECDDCKFEWRDLYQLTGYEKVER